MALTSLDKENTNRLLYMLNIAESDNNNRLETIKNNYSAYSQLTLLAEQIVNLQNKAKSIIENCEINKKLHEIPTNSKKVCGNYYYHYIIDDREFLSIIEPDQWNTYSEYLGKYLYNYDNIFYRCD